MQLYLTFFATKFNEIKRYNYITYEELVSTKKLRLIFIMLHVIKENMRDFLH